MKHIATGLLFDRNYRLLIYLRDDKPSIPFPNHWDLFGGYVEAGETPEEALIREIREELDYELSKFSHFRDYVVHSGDAFVNTKHVYWAVLDKLPEDLVLREGQRLTSIPLADRRAFRFANILGSIVEDFASSDFNPSSP